MNRRLQLLLVVLVVNSCLAAQTGAEGRVALDEKVFTASKIYSLVQLHLTSMDPSSGYDSDTSYKNYLRAILAKDGRREFDLATFEYVAQLQSGHTVFWDSWLDKDLSQPLGFYAAPVDNKWVIQTSSIAELRPGDVLSGLDGRPIEEFIGQQLKYVSASSIAAQRHNLFLLPYLFPKQFTLTLDNQRKIPVDRTKTKQLEIKTEGRWLTKGQLAYIRIPTFFYPVLEEAALNYVNQFRNAKVLIVDVRNNPGGLAATRLISAFTDRPYHRWKESISVRIDSFGPVARAFQGKSGINSIPEYVKGYADALSTLGNARLMLGGEEILPGQPIFYGRLIILVDGGCISACEDFIEPLKDSGRATLVGETTQGSAGLPYTYDLHDGMSLRIAVRRLYFPNGSEFEGIGIKPDEEVHPTIESLKSGRDVILQRALELAAKP